MNILFDNLESLIDAPNGIEKARELILQLAIQGKLTEQDPKDEPASELIKKIKKEKEKLITEGKIRNQNYLPLIKDEDKTFIIPHNWAWCRVGEIAQHNSGKTLDSGRNSGIPRECITTSNLYWGNFEINNLKRILIEDNELERCTASKGDLLICEGGEAGRAAVWEYDYEVCFQNHIHRVRPYSKVNPTFLYWYFFLMHLNNELDNYRKGVGISNLSGKTLSLIVIPLPPLNEQKRIVEKVNSLMALLDELEEKTERRNQKRIKLNNASLEKLLTSKDDKELKTNWTRIEENFSTLYSVPENVEKLKQAILQLAVQGKLTSEWRNSIYERHPELVSGSKTSVQLDEGSIYEPASELLKKIKKEKEKLITEGKIKKQKELPPIKEEEKPFELPKGWEWVRLGEATNYGIALKSEGSELTDQTWVLELEDIEKITSRVLQKVRFRDKKFKSTKNFFQNGDVIYGKLRPYLDKVIVADEEGVCTTEMIPIRGYCDTDPHYLRLVLKSPYFVEYATNSTHGMNLPRLGTDKARMALFPITSLNEQKRIVEKVNELMSLCNALEEKLTKKEATAEKLVGAVVNAVANKPNKPKDDIANKKEKLIGLVNELIKKHHKGFEKLR